MPPETDVAPKTMSGSSFSAGFIQHLDSCLLLYEYFEKNQIAQSGLHGPYGPELENAEIHSPNGPSQLLHFAPAIN